MHEWEPIVVFDRDVKASELNKLAKNFFGDLVVNGNLLLDEDLQLNCNLYIKNISCDNFLGYKSLRINGALFCNMVDVSNISVQDLYANQIEALKIYVAGDVECIGKVYAHKIEYIGSIYLKEIGAVESIKSNPS